MKFFLILTIGLLLATSCTFNKHQTSTKEVPVPEINKEEVKVVEEKEKEEVKVVEEKEMVYSSKIEKNPALSIAKLENGKNKYIGENRLFESEGIITKYSIEYDPNKWEVLEKDKLDRGEGLLLNKTDEECSIILSVYPKGFEMADVYEEFENGIVRVGWGKSIYYYVSVSEGQNYVTIESYLEDESAHPNCLDDFREITETLKLEK